MAGGREPIAPWAPGEAPVVLASHGDPDIKQSALAPSPDGDAKGGESVASKGEVTGVDQRPRSPAERLALAGAARAKAEKCLANAVYFEARGESVRGQIAVAQVVMNRVFSPFYPNDVCGVVYQNSHRHLACQFTFACDGLPDIVTEPDAWERAKRISRDMLDGKLWMPEVSKSTHYHAFWVHPDWVNEMKKVYKLGVHTFYRPRAWGDGEDEPTWGDAAITEKEAAAEEAKGPVSHSLEWLKSEEGQASLRQNARK
jgi:spore germination cell wall hydrolase CwlJ-like protein